MAKIYLIRHAETEPTGDDGTLWPLSERGEEQVKQLAAQPFWDEVKAIISSPAPKAIATVHPIAVERNIPIHAHDGLRELRRTKERLADYDARVIEVFQRPALSVGGWERAADAQRRMLTTLEELIQKFDGAPFAVASHGMALALLLASLQDAMGYAYEIWQDLGFASVTLIERE